MFLEINMKNKKTSRLNHATYFCSQDIVAGPFLHLVASPVFLREIRVPP
jgi:hypothetical protein